MFYQKSILDDIKKMIGGPDSGEDDSFELDLMIHINSAFDTLRQLGVGPEKGFYITGRNETWGDFFGDSPGIPSVRSYIYAKVKLIFDPPSSSFVNESLKQMIAEFEWRMNVDVETPAFDRE